MSFLQNHRSRTDNSRDLVASGSTQIGGNGNSCEIIQFSKKTLPRINLPSFRGSNEAWLSSHDLFKSLVDINQDIPEVEKLYHLKRC